MQLKPSTMHPRPLTSMGSTTTQVNTDPPATLAPRIINDTTEKDSLIASWRESKLSKAAFCREYNLSTNQFYVCPRGIIGPDPFPNANGISKLHQLHKTSYCLQR